MGAYLSHPKTDKISTDESNNYLSVGASSMQGWRNSQEDAHNSILNFDTNTAFFAVYDGHGGAEVSTYCADKLPKFLKSLSAYVGGNYEQALIDAFLGFDKTLLAPGVIEILKVLAGEKNFVDGDDSDALEDDEDEDLAELHEEGTLPLDEVMEKYKGHPSMPSLKKLKDNNSSKPQSPYLRGRRAAAVIADAANRAELDPDSKPEGSSTSKAALGALQEDGPSSSKSSPGSKLESEEDSTVSSSSSSASKSNSANNSAINADEAEAAPTASTTGEALETALNGKNTDTFPDSSAPKGNEQNGNVSSSQVNKKGVPTTSTSKDDDTVSGSSDAKNLENKQNGNVESSTKSSTNQEANSSTITSTSKDKRKARIDEDEDVEFDGNNSNARQALEYSSEDEEELGEDDTTDEDADYDDDDEVEEDDEADDEEDEESYLANEQFCANMIEEPGKDSGCTAVVGLLNGRDLYVANAGDSRCVVCRNGKAIEMSLDHKPEDDEESSRIIRAGGRVTLDGRVNGGLNLSRALGDHAYKMNHDLLPEDQMISALPDIKKLIISEEDEFMVLACDGIWNFMTSEEVVDFVRLRINDENKKMSEICEELFDACLAPNTLGDGTGCDNMTAVIVRFKPSILKLPTKIIPNETEDILMAQQEAESGQKAQKRVASPTSDDNDFNEPENKTKRLKTDDGENKTSSSSKTNSTACSIVPTDSTNTASTTTSNNESRAATVAKEVQKECDSVVASST